VSVQAPVKNRQPDESATIAMLDGLPLWVRSVIAHPDALSDVVRYRALGTRLVLENMDDRKITGRVAHEMERFFEELPDAGFCLDVAHVRSIDPTMDPAHELLDQIASAHVCDTCISARSKAGGMCRSPRKTKDCSPRSWTAAETCLGSSKLGRLTGGRRK